MRKQIANIITIGRILGCICLLFCPVFSIGFYAIYIFCESTTSNAIPCLVVDLDWCDSSHENR